MPMLNNIHYRDCGDGPVILFGHSYLWDLHMWDEVIQILSPRFRCIAVDLWGHGQTPALEGLTLEYMAELYREFMKSLGVEEYSICGLSIGGMWGALVAQKTPQVKRLIIMNSSLSPEPDAKLQAYKGLLAQIKQAGHFPPAIIEAISPGFFSPNVSPPLLKKFKENLQKTPQKNIPCISEIGLSLFERGNLLNEREKLMPPTLVIAGEHDSYRSKEESQHIANSCNAPLKLLNAGHISVKEQAAKAASLIADFLK